jgi:hypothetical protein
VYGLSLPRATAGSCAICDSVGGGGGLKRMYVVDDSYIGGLSITM